MSSSEQNSNLGLSAAQALKLMKSTNEEALELSDEDLKALQAHLLTILDDIINLCEEHDLRYTLSGGTALGAIRHKGFIPWDDDADLNMPHDDCCRLVQILRETKSDKYEVFTPRDTGGYGLSFTQIRKRGTTARKQEDFNKKNFGVALDIFCLENMFKNGLIRRIHGVMCLFCGLALSSRLTYRYRNEFLHLACNDQELTRIFKRKIRLGRLFGFFSLERWGKIVDVCYSACKNENSYFLGIPSGRLHFFGEINPRSTFFPTKEALFEGRTWKVPGDSDAYLNALYGDYMRVPEDSEREKHIYIDLDL